MKQAQLNPEQQRAVLFVEQPLRILAAAGSGKTRVIIYKILHLIKLGLAPEAIAVITFTNKAADEMKARLKKLTNQHTVDQIWMMTYHALCFRILKIDLVHEVYNRGFTVLDAADSRHLMERILLEQGGVSTNEGEQKPNFKKQIMHALYFISAQKRQGLYPDDQAFQERSKDFIPEDVAVYRRYQQQLQQSNAFDYDDLINYTFRLLKQNLSLAYKWQTKFQYILVDEFQDTNFAQLQIIKLLAQEHQKITVVGDPNQTIYTWRGADSKLFLDFTKFFPNAVTIYLHQNYRSSREILQLASNFMTHHEANTPSITAYKGANGVIPWVVTCGSRFDEARWIAKKISQLVYSQRYQWRDFTILLRANYLSRIFEQIFQEKEVKFAVYRDYPFWGRKEIKDCLALLQVLFLDVIPDFCWERVLTNLKSIGIQTFNKLLEDSKKNGSDLRMFLKTNLVDDGFSPKLTFALTPVKKWLFLTLADYQKPIQIMEKLIDIFQLNKELSSNEQDNIHELQEIIKEKSGEATFSPAGLSDWYIGFLNFVALYANSRTDRQHLRNVVHIMTIHKAKGLENKNIIIPCMTKGIFPSSRSTNITEEKRIFYVAMTRAQENLYITYHQFKNYQRGGALERSDFIDSLNPSAFRAVDANELFWHDSTTTSRNFSNFKTKRKAPTSTTSFTIGSTVRHRIYGKGTVRGVRTEELIIDFPDHGQQIIHPRDVHVVM